MKKFICIACLFISFNSFSQESTIDKITQQTCDYISTEEFTSLPKKDKTLKLGLLIIKLYSENDEALKAEGYEFEISSPQSGREFGQKIGLNMANFCPDALLLLAEAEMNDDNEVEISQEDLPPPPPAPKSDEDLSISGTLKAIHNTALSYIEVEDEYGKTHVFLIVEQITGKELLSKSTIESQLKVSYKEEYFYDLSEVGYRKKKVITYIEKL